MDENGWEYGEDDEELFELAMHDRQYRDYKSGVAKKRFEDELQRAKDAAMAKERIFGRGNQEAETCQGRPDHRACQRAGALGGFRRRSIHLLHSSDVNISMMRCSAIISTPWGEYEKICDRIYRTCGGNMCATRYQCT